MNCVLPEARSIVPELPHDCLAVGAWEQERPIGLAIVRRAAGEETAHVVSLVVVEEYRREGVGRRILAGLGNLLKSNGIGILAVEYMASCEESGEVGLFLQAVGFAPPVLGVAVWSGKLALFEEMPWVRRMPLPRGLHVEPWSALTAEQHAYIQSGEENWYPSILSPLMDGSDTDDERSLLLRDGERIVGWMIVEPLDANTIVFKSMFVHASYRRKGRGIALMAESFRRFLHDPTFENGIFFVEGDNADMLAFMRKHLSRPNMREEGMWRTFKRL